MKPFTELGQAGRTARLRRLAMRALAHYDLAVASVRPLTSHYNAVFRIDTADGGRAVLRVNRPGNRSLVDIRSELAWLAALRRETDLVAPEPLPTREGALVTTVEAPGVPEPRHCVLFRWIEGRGVDDRPAPRTLFNLGATMARLHEHAAGFAPPAGFTERRLDQAWTFGRPAAVYSDEPDQLLTPERRAVLRSSAARVQATLDDLYADRSGLRFLHCDLHLGNVKVTRAGLGVFDFDDSTWGYPVQDIGISLYYLEYHPAYHDLRAAFARGYASVRPWPMADDREIDTFIVARDLDLISLVCHTDDSILTSYLPTLIEKGVARLSPWLAG
jgi:Ser/Thr protein kinase RdoA (MazF antagonist)